MSGDTAGGREYELEDEIHKLRKQLKQRRARMKALVAKARREALEEAAKVADTWDYEGQYTGVEIANAIRALEKEPKP